MERFSAIPVSHSTTHWNRAKSLLKTLRRQVNRQRSSRRFFIKKSLFPIHILIISLLRNGAVTLRLQHSHNTEQRSHGLYISHRAWGTCAKTCVFCFAAFRCYCFLQHSNVSVKLDAAKTVKVNVKVEDDLGELELGKLDQEYFKDPDLRELLAKTALDADRMKGLKDQKLYLIYSVFYSERLLLKGKRKHEVFIGCIFFCV